MAFVFRIMTMVMMMMVNKEEEEGHWTAGVPKNGPFRMIGKINEGCLLGFDAVRFDFRSGGAASD